MMPELSREKQEDHHKAKASPGYIMRPYLKNEKGKKEKNKREGGKCTCALYMQKILANQIQ